MRVEGKYMLGTVSEVAEVITENILDGGYVSGDAKKLFRNYSFGILDDKVSETESLEFIFDIPEFGIYGIKSIDTGFDNGALELFADYYGGGSGFYQSVEYRTDRKECQKVIAELIRKTLSVSQYCDKNTIIIAEGINEEIEN